MNTRDRVVVANFLRPLKVYRVLWIKLKKRQDELLWLGQLLHLLSDLGNYSISLSKLGFILGNMTLIIIFSFLLGHIHRIFFPDLLLLHSGKILKGGYAVVITIVHAFESLFTIIADQIHERAVICEVVSHASVSHKQVLTSAIQDTLASFKPMR